MPATIPKTDNHGRPGSDYVVKITKMSDDELFKETKDMIWFSAFAANNPRSDWHWQCDACYDEWVKRNKTEQYSKAWKYVSEG